MGGTADTRLRSLSLLSESPIYSSDNVPNSSTHTENGRCLRFSRNTFTARSGDASSAADHGAGRLGRIGRRETGLTG